MANILRIDLTETDEVLQANFQTGFELTSYANGTSIELEAGRVEYLGGYPYRVANGNLTVTGSPSDGVVYLYIAEDGDGTATASLSNTVPSWNSTNGSFYNGTDKALFKFTKSGSNYNDRYKIDQAVKPIIADGGEAIIGGMLAKNSLPSMIYSTPIRLQTAGAIPSGSIFGNITLTTGIFSIHFHCLSVATNLIGTTSNIDITDGTGVVLGTSTEKRYPFLVPDNGIDNAISFSDIIHVSVGGDITINHNPSPFSADLERSFVIIRKIGEYNG